MKMFRVAFSTLVGNTLEFYDLTLYAYFAPTIALHFFPKQDTFTGIASAFALFFIGYLARPLGALFFGRMGDRLGRKPALLVSIWLMALSTVGLGLLPIYQTIGVWAPMLLLILRILQGFSCGGELTGSAIFIIEHAPREKRGFYGSFADTGTSMGALLAVFASWLIHISFSDSVIIAWAWRLPFLFGLLGGLLGWFARRAVPETELFLETQKLPQSYFNSRRDYAKQVRPALIIMGIKLMPSVLGYLFYVYITTYMSNILHYTMSQALTITMVSITFLAFLEPWMGKLSDHIGRRRLMMFSIIGSVIWVWPYFWLLQQHNVALALLAQGIMTIFAAAYLAIALVTMVEMIPIQMRFTVVSLAYAVAASVFSGMTPLVASLLINITHSYYSLILYVLISALISAIAIYKARETRLAPE